MLHGGHIVRRERPANWQSRQSHKSLPAWSLLSAHIFGTECTDFTARAFLNWHGWTFVAFSSIDSCGVDLKDIVPPFRPIEIYNELDDPPHHPLSRARALARMMMTPPSPAFAGKGVGPDSCRRHSCRCHRPSLAFAGKGNGLDGRCCSCCWSHPPLPASASIEPSSGRVRYMRSFAC